MNSSTAFDKINFGTILILSVIVLIIAHATLGDLGRNLWVSGFTVILITFLLTSVFLTVFKRNIFFILIILYILLHFPIFLYGGGGLFNLVTSTLLPLIILLKAKDWEFKDKKVWFLIILLFIFNSIGYFTGSLGTLHIINGFVAFIGIITIFLSPKEFCLLRNG